MAADGRSSSRSYPRLLVCTDYDFVRNGYPHSREGERQTDRQTDRQAGRQTERERESLFVWPFTLKQVGLRLDWLLLHSCLAWRLSFLDPLARPLALPFSGSRLLTNHCRVRLPEFKSLSRDEEEETKGTILLVHIGSGGGRICLPVDPPVRSRIIFLSLVASSRNTSSTQLSSLLRSRGYDNDDCRVQSQFHSFAAKLRLDRKLLI